MTEKEWMKEGIDLKLTALLYRKKLWISIVCALAGAIFAGGLYFLVHVVYAPAREYEAVSKLYLTFAPEDDGDAHQYYNGYTWNDLMGTEPILDKIMEELGGAYPSREDVKTKITADILSDIRLLTVTVTTNDPAETEDIIRASENALVRFGEEMVEFDKIEVIEHGQASLVVVENETVRAVIAGLVIGFLLSLLGLAFACIVDDSVYVPSDFEKRYGYPVLGVTFAGNETLGKAELEEHLQAVKMKKACVITVDTAAFPENFSEMAKEAAFKEKEAASKECEVSGQENAGIILEIPYGKGNGKIVERCVAEVAFRGCEILGAVITGADEGLYRLYFATFDRKKRK